MRLATLVLALLAAPAQARVSLGTFDDWGAFRDDRPPRCFAIAEPRRDRKTQWRPFASVATWPTAGVRGQVHIRLGRAKLPAAPVTLTVGTQRFQMVAGAADAWAPDPRTDAAIVAAMRSAKLLTVRSRAASGGGFSESYRLAGAATAIDAATLGCARR